MVEACPDNGLPVNILKQDLNGLPASELARHFASPSLLALPGLLQLRLLYTPCSKSCRAIHVTLEMLSVYMERRD